MTQKYIFLLCILHFVHLQGCRCDDSSSSTVPGPSFPVKISVDTSQPTWKTNEMYLSLGMDSNLIRHRWQSFDFSSVRLKTLGKALSPARLRLMGTDGDRMTLKGPCGKQKHRRSTVDYSQAKATLFPDTSFFMTCNDWDNINKFAKSVGWRILFGFNNQLRKNLQWDPSNAMEILNYSIEKGYSSNLDFELGNEPDLYWSWDWHQKVNASQLAVDFHTFKKLLNSPKYQKHYANATIAGPDVAGGVGYLAAFLDEAGDTIDAVTFHNYYGGSNLPTVKDATNPDVLDSYIGVVKAIADVVRLSPRPQRKIWNGETSSTYAPVGSNLYETYAAGFMLVDKMGMSARMGIDLVIRQTFFGFWFALVDLGMYPVPNYWISVLYTNLVGREVFYVHQGKDSKYVRFYAHCTNTAKSNYTSGSVTVYGMNLYDSDVMLNFENRLSNQIVHEYRLTPYGIYTGLTAKYVALNRKIMTMPNDKTLPEMPPKVIPVGDNILLPSKAIAYYVFPNAKVAACS